MKPFHSEINGMLNKKYIWFLLKLIVRLTDFFVKKFFVRLQKKIKIKSGFQTLPVNVFRVKF